MVGLIDAYFLGQLPRYHETGRHYKIPAKPTCHIVGSSPLEAKRTNTVLLNGLMKILKGTAD